MAAIAAVTFDGLEADFALLEARARVRPNLTVAAGVAYLHVEPRFDDVQFRAHATVSAQAGRWLIDDRNMISLNADSANRYRNRLRAGFPVTDGRYGLRLLAFSELFIDLDRGRIERNNLAAGLGADLGDCCRAEIYQVWSDNRGTEDGRYILAMLIVTFAR